MTPEYRVFQDRDLFRIILGHALSTETQNLFKNYELIFNCTLTCKKWRSIVFQLFIPHFNKYNYEGDQFNFDNIMYVTKLIKRSYFESDSHSHYKQPIIENDCTYILVKPTHYTNLLENAKSLQLKQKNINNRFMKMSCTKICKICSTISQTRTVCGSYLNKIRLKKIEREKAQNDAKTTEEVSDTQNGQDRDPDLPAYTDETDEEAVPDVEDAIPVDIRDAIDTADIVSDGNEDEPDEPDEDEPDEDDDI
jgi:hypothetical protein